MSTWRQAQILRVFISESAAYNGRPLFQAIVEAAREQGLAGATVLHGVMGYAGTSDIHRSSILRLAENLPMVVEIVDTEERLSAFMPLLEQMMEHGLVTVEDIQMKSFSGNHVSSG